MENTIERKGKEREREKMENWLIRKFIKKNYLHFLFNPKKDRKFEVSFFCPSHKDQNKVPKFLIFLFDILNRNST